MIESKCNQYEHNYKILENSVICSKCNAKNLLDETVKLASMYARR